MAPTKPMLRRVAVPAIAFLFGAVFVFAGVVKARDPQLFLIQVRGFRLLPDPWAAWLALGLPWLEIFGGLAVLSGWCRRGGLLLLNLCLVAFAAALVTAWARGLDIECGCFGKTFKTGLLGQLALDGALLLSGLWLLFGSRRSSLPENLRARL